MEDTEGTSEWIDGMGFGIPELDAEERRLGALVHELNLAIGDGGDRAEIQRLMNQILLDALRHFDQEERVLSECAYPSPKGHAALHLQMRAELEHAMAELCNPEARAMWTEYGLLIMQLFFEHMRQEAMKYRSILHTNLRAGPQEV